MALSANFVRNRKLILTGVFMRDLDKISAQLTSSIPSQTVESVSIFTPLPSRFTGVDTWPKTSNRLCWSCDLIPRDYPRFIPMNMAEVDGHEVCDAYGHFNTWNCAVRYINRELQPEQRECARRRISIFEAMFSGKYKEKIVEAPNKVIMKAYCGDVGITPQQYCDRIDALNEMYDINIYKMSHLCKPDS